MSEEERPDLGAILDHYGIEHHEHKTIEMLSCPFHEDRTPSLSVRKDTGLWNCKSCGEVGDAFTLVMKKEGIDFVGARKFVAGLGLANGGAGGGNEQLSGSTRGNRHSVAHGKGDRASGSGYKPSWRR